MKGFRLVHALALIAGLLFLYVPIGILVLYSFNASRLVTVWGGFSTQWYASLLQNQSLKDAALLSLAMAIASATIATVLGTLAALALERARPGRAKPHGPIAEIWLRPGGVSAGGSRCGRSASRHGST